MTTSIAPLTDFSMLRIVADEFEQAQRHRVATGERIRAILQHRDTTDAIIPDKREVKEVLDAIKRGVTDGPVGFLGRSYRLQDRAERAAEGEMLTYLDPHPVWPWMDKVNGVGLRLACKILARLDIEKAPHPSSFSKHAGLATVPGYRFVCPKCGRKRNHVDKGLKLEHVALDAKTRKCKVDYEIVAGPEDGVRAAQKPAKRTDGKKGCGYDTFLKKVLIGQLMPSFLKQDGKSRKNGGPGNFYGGHYYVEKERLISTRPGWAPGRIDLTARRVVCKLFLSHIWEVWMKANGETVGREAYAYAVLGHDPEGYISPEEAIRPR